MSVPWPGSMRGSRLRSPLLLLLFLLLLKAGTVLCQDEGEDEPADAIMANEDMSAGDPADMTTSDSLQDDTETTQTVDPPPTDEESQVDDTSVLSAEMGSGAMDIPPEDATDPSVTLQNDTLSSTIILVPVGLVVLIIAMIVCGIFISRRCNRKDRKKGLKEEDPYLDGSATEKVPMPMFEEDVPSVLELEMEELDQLMQQDGEATKQSMQT